MTVQLWPECKNQQINQKPTVKFDRENEKNQKTLLRFPLVWAIIWGVITGLTGKYMIDVFDLRRKKPLLYVRFKRAHSENRPGGSFHESPEEQEERAKLRKIYIDSVKANLVSQLENTYILQSDGTKKKVTKK